MSRVDAAKVAIMKSILPTAGTYAASDAFFPFRDGLDLLADAGITAIIQPGGSSATPRSSPPRMSAAWRWSSRGDGISRH